MLVLAMLATAMTTVVSASSSSQHRRLETGGSTDCPCVSEYAQGITVGQPKIPGETLVYPATYGLNHCLMHDLGLPPSCGNTLNISALPTWCTFTWCYIDKDNCAKTDVLESSYFPGMHYSGQTCGGDTDWSGFMTEQQCKTDCPANTTLPRIAFITHGNTGNHFWTDPSWGIYGYATAHRATDLVLSPGLHSLPRACPTHMVFGSLSSVAATRRPRHIIGGCAWCGSTPRATPR